MTKARITRRMIENALKIMVATAPDFVTFVRYFFEYCTKLDAENTNFVVIWGDDNDIFEIFNTRSKKSSFIDFSAELAKMD